ncbi:MAG: mercury(II) reductase [Gemmatimonadota bacterium]
MARYDLVVEGMTCEHCAEKVRGALVDVDGVLEADVSLTKGQAQVQASGPTTVDALLEAVREAGYRARPAGRDGPERPDDDRSAAKRLLLILGGGSAAFAAAIRAADLGARVTMIERGTIGGTCVNVGCVPSKTLIRAAEIHHHRAHHPFDGIPATDGRVDLGRLVAQKDELVVRLRRERYRDVLAEYPSVELVAGEARLTGSRSVAIQLGDGGNREVEADRIVIATGSHPWTPPIEGLAETPYWTNVEALAAGEVPQRLLVVGGSAVGAELAQMYARLGSRVTLLEALPTLVPNEDAELGRALAGYFADEGIEIHTGAAVRSVERRSEGVRLVAEVDGGERAFEGDRLLVATGRRANVDALDLEATGVETDRKGFVIVDESMETTSGGIFAAGDCTPHPQFVYVAAKAGTIAAENAVGEGGARLDLSAMPAVTFTDPQVASVGPTEERARERGEEVVARTLAMEDVPRPLANRDTRGMIKIVARESDGRILAVHVLSPAAGEVIQTAVLAVKLGLSVGDLADALFPYLTEVEGLKLAAQSFTREPAHLSCCAG